MKFHNIFQLADLLNTSFAFVNSYLVIGLRDSFKVDVIDCSGNSSSNAPSNALVDGGYFRDNRISSFLSSKFNLFSISKKRVHDFFTFVSGIFLCI